MYYEKCISYASISLLSWIQIPALSYFEMQNFGILSLNFAPLPQNTTRKLAQLPNHPLDTILRISVIPSLVQKLHDTVLKLCVRIIILRSAF